MLASLLVGLWVVLVFVIAGRCLLADYVVVLRCFVVCCFVVCNLCFVRLFGFGLLFVVLWEFGCLSGFGFTWLVVGLAHQLVLLFVIYCMVTYVVLFVCCCLIVYL